MKITINDIEVDAIVDNDIALTKSVNKMQSLSSRNGSFSTEIEAAFSTNNRQLTANSQSTDSVTNFPYSVNLCEIEAHGYNVMQGFATLEETNNNYKIRAFGELSNIFDLIGDAKLKELNLDYSNGSAINHIWSYANIIANRNNTWQSGFIYPNINYGKWDDKQVKAYWDDLYPSIFCKYLFLRIFHSIGYAVSGEFLTNDLFEREILPMVKIPSTPDYALEGYKTETENITTKENITPAVGTFGSTHPILYPLVFDSIITNGSLQLFNQSIKSSSISISPIIGVVTSENATCFKPTQAGQVDVEVNLTVANITNLSDLALGLFEHTPSLNRYNIETLTTSTNGSYTMNKKINMYASDTYYFLAFLAYPTIVTNPTQFDITAINWVNTYDSQILIPGNTVFVNECLPDVSQKDFLTTIVNQYNLMITIDSSLRTVNFSYFNSVDANKANAIDWSDKLDVTELPTIQYAIDGYSQNNLLNYETDDNDSELRKAVNYGQGTLFCNNLNLEKTSEVFKSKFAPITRIPALKETPTIQAFIQLWQSEDNGVTFRTQSVKPRIAYIIRGETFTIHGNDHEIGGGSGASNTGLSAGVYFQDLEFAGSLIPKHYNIVVNMLNSPYFLNANFFLKVKDYNEIDFTAPIYLECVIKGFGNIKGYFYCNEIKQFKINRYETTTVELIKI